MKLRQLWEDFIQKFRKPEQPELPEVEIPEPTPPPIPEPVVKWEPLPIPEPEPPPPRSRRPCIETTTVTVGMLSGKVDSRKFITFDARKLACRFLSNRQKSIQDVLYERDGRPFVHTYIINDGKPPRFSWTLRQVRFPDLKLEGRFEHFYSSARMYFREAI